MGCTWVSLLSASSELMSLQDIWNGNKLDAFQLHLNFTCFIVFFSKRAKLHICTSTLLWNICLGETLLMQSNYLVLLLCSVLSFFFSYCFERILSLQHFFSPKTFAQYCITRIAAKRYRDVILGSFACFSTQKSKFEKFKFKLLRLL